METTVDVRSQVHDCLRYLADRCDGAHENDHEGFNKLDARFGHQLASTAQLTLAQVVVGAKMLRKYRRQLKDGGLHLPDVQEIEAYLAEQKRAFRERVISPVQIVSTSSEPSESAYRVFVEHGRIVVENPYDQAVYMALRPLKQTVEGWAFNRYERKEWSYPLEAINQVLDALHPFEADFSFSPEIAVVIDQARQDAEQAKQEAELEEAFAELERLVALDAVKPYLDGEPIANGQVLYAHQKEAVRLLIERKRMILAHDLGLGKTRSALIAAKGYGLPIFVICPTSVQINWFREAEMVETPIEVYSWAKLPEPPDDHDYILIGDEAHYCQNLAAKRSQAFLALAEHARAVYAITGTPMKNAQPINLYPLLVACKHPLARNLKAYEHRYCNAHLKSIGGKKQAWDVTGASHLDELHQKIKDVVLYKKKDECLKDLPPKVRLMRQAEVNKEEERAYHAMIDRLWKEHDARMKQKHEERLAILRQDLSSKLDDDLLLEMAAQLGDDIDEEALDELGADSENARALVELGIFRHAGSQAKVGSAIAIAQEIVEQGESIVLFVAFRDTAAKLTEALDAECLTGDVSKEERQAMIDRFQVKQTRILICMIGAGGVGITLTAAQTVVLVDRPWTPGDAVQAEDRCIAEGQLVMAEQGLTPIEAINVGERVLTHTGKWQPVTATKKREHRGLMTRITYTRYSEPLYSTHDHRIFVKRGNNAPEWIQAHEALPGDFLVMPRPHSLEHPPLVKLPDQSRYIGTFVGSWGVMQTNGRYKALADQFELNDDLLWLFGWYLAEGFASTVAGKGRFISLAGHQDERPILERMQRTLSGMRVNSTIYTKKATKTIELRAFSYELAHWFSEWFGDGCECKHIPAFLLNLPVKQSQTLIDAYVAGDGYARKRQQEWVSVSPALASQIALLALQCGYAPTLRMVNNDTHNNGHWIGCYTINGEPDNQSLALWDEQYVYHPIRKVETFFAPRRPSPTYVYDLTVEEDHSFVVGQAIVHNCHRIGQQGSVTAIWLQYGPIDEKIDLLLQQKQERIDLVLQGKRKSMRGVSRSIRSMAKEILDSIHSGTSIEAVFDLVDTGDSIQTALKQQPHPVPLVSPPVKVVDSTLAEMPLPAKTSVPDVPAQPANPSIGESKVVKVYGDKAMHQYIQAQEARGLSTPLAAYERVVEQRQITFICAQCHTTVTQWRYPSRGPRYCSDECRDEAHKEQTKERVRRYRERKAAQQGENPS